MCTWNSCSCFCFCCSCPVRLCRAVAASASAARASCFCFCCSCPALLAASVSGALAETRSEASRARPGRRIWGPWVGRLVPVSAVLLTSYCSFLRASSALTNHHRRRSACKLVTAFWTKCPSRIVFPLAALTAKLPRAALQFSRRLLFADGPDNRGEGLGNRSSLSLSCWHIVNSLNCLGGSPAYRAYHCGRPTIVCQ